MAEQEQREFEFSDANFNYIRQFVLEHTGIVLTAAKKDMVYGRLAKLIRRGHLNSFDEFCQALEQEDAEHQEFMINAITTNLTAFFREQHHFDYLADKLIPELIKRNMGSRRIRIWSAGCSTGEEPYSIAMTLLESLPQIDNWDVKILATDLDANVINHGKEGVYQYSRVTGIPNDKLKSWFQRGTAEKADMVRVHPRLRELITFKRLNLLHEWPMQGSFDIIFCRNVVIYFDKNTQRKLFDRYANILKSGSHLFIGHSENLFGVSTRFDSLGYTIYKKNH